MTRPGGKLRDAFFTQNTMRIITLCYRKILDVNNAKPWDKLVFESSYLEFKMQAQNFTQGTKYTSYAQLVNNIPNAQQLSARVMPAISGYVQQLNGVIPDILNNAGIRTLRFEKYQFEIINSDINDKARHQAAINFYTGPMSWHENIGEYLLLSAHQPHAAADVETATNLIQMQPYLNICSLKSI